MSNIALKDRINWVGSSETAALLGVSPFMTRFELWHQKYGDLAPPNLSDNERVVAGQFMEPAIAAWAGHKWQWPIRPVTKYETHPTVAKLGSSLDFDTEGGEPVEIKNVDGLIFHNEYIAEGEGIIDAPLHHLVQLQTQMACRPEVAHGWLVVCVGGNSLKRMKVERHPATIAKIEAGVTRFWQAVEAGHEPQIDWAADAAAVIAMMSIAGSDAVDFKGDCLLVDLCAAYKAAGEVEKAGEADKKTAKAKILYHIGEAGKALCDDGYTVSAGMVKSSEVPAHAKKEYRRFSVNKKKDPETSTTEGIDV